jgi:hypothetical protein
MLLDPTTLTVTIPNYVETLKVYPNTLVDTGGDSLLIHASASTHQHGFVSPTAGAWSSLLTYQIRRDGFVFAAVAKGTEIGSFETKPLLWGSGELSLNLDAGENGRVDVAVLDPRSHTPIVGYSEADAVPSVGNSTALIARWASGAMLQRLEGRAVILSVRLVGSDVKLYALRGLFTWVNVDK